ncbi:hypothetical protein HDU99_008610 [Rhizoclosmatium hyalinum]|nr:hypothetical protein HDU99_008610 [Rhizoclosmatium hyalinum]
MIRQTMESVEQDISTFRDVTREKMDSLLLDETHLTKELLTITDRIESSFHATIDESDEPLIQDAAKAAEESSIPKQPPTQQDTESGLKEVKAFQRYLHRHGGYYGGWDDLSHTAYLTLRQKYGANNPKLVHACVSSIPGIGYPEAHAHEQWYRQFRELLEAKKEAIRVWRERKAAAAAKAEDEMRESQEVQRDISVVKMELEMEARERMKENLAVWKGKQEKLMRERKRMEKEERERREAEKERWRERNALLKEKVTQHAQEKAQQEAIQRQLMEEARLMEQSANEKAARQEMERLKQRDAELIELKKKRLAEKERAEKEREERLTKIRSLVSVEGVVDPTRVLQPTKNQLYRASATKEPTSFVALNQLPRRSVPTWRKGL